MSVTSARHVTRRIAGVIGQGVLTGVGAVVMLVLVAVPMLGLLFAGMFVASLFTSGIWVGLVGFVGAVIGFGIGIEGADALFLAVDRYTD